MHTIAMLSVSVLVMSACGSTPTPSRGRAQSGPADAPTRPFAAELERPIPVSDLTMMLRWVGTRYDEARLGDRRKVRVPLIRRTPNIEDDSPEWAIAASPTEGPFQWLAIIDGTGQIPRGDWSGWAEGSFTGTELQYRSRDSGVTMMLPVFEVRSQEPRGNEAPVVSTFPR